MEDPPLEHHIPVEVDVLAASLAEALPPERREPFARLLLRLGAHFDAELGRELQELRRRYRPFDPSRDTLPVPGEDAGIEARARFVAGLEGLLRRANYVELERAELERALQGASPVGVLVELDLDALDLMRVFARGRYAHTIQTGRWRWRKEVEIVSCRRLFLALSPADARERVHLRLYKDVSRSDLEMFFPNTRVRMRPFDKWKLGLTGGGGTLGGAMVTATKIGAATGPFGWGLALAGFAGLLWRQVAQVLHHRTRYMARHSAALYFHSLDHDLGALVHVAQMALQQELKEAVLAYGVLAAADAPLEAGELDRRAEAHLRVVHGASADFEVADGVAKLEELGLLVRGAGGLAVAETAAGLAPAPAGEACGKE